MKTLFLDIASSDALVACVEGGARKSVARVDRKVREAGLMDAVKTALGDAKWNGEDLRRVACVVGPGGFMSIRVGIAFANALAWARGLPMAGIHGSDLIRARANAGDFLWIHSTKSGEVFVRGFGSLTPRWPEPIHVTLDVLLSRFSSGDAVAGELLPEHRDALVAAGAAVLPLAPEESVIGPLCEGLFYAEKPLIPWYGREG
jgi:tRNA A37 threonylcarbamoyladenosine modification protein TsaB